MLEIIPETWLTTAVALKTGTLFALAALVFAAWRLGYRHRRENDRIAAQDNRNRSLFQLGASDRTGDRTEELVNQLRQHDAS